MWRLNASLKSIVCSISECQAFLCGRRDTAGLEAIRFLWTSNESQREIVELLNLGERPRASVLLLELSNGHQELHTRDFISILGYCARKPDPLFAMEAWKAMVEKGIRTDNKCFFLTFRALCKGGYLKEAVNMLNIQGENPEIHPTLPFYNHLLGACIQRNILTIANDCLHMMEQRCIGKNAITFSLLLELAVLQKDLPAAREIWQKYISYYGLSIATLQKFIRSFTLLRDLESAYLALQHIVALSLQQNFYAAKYDEGGLVESRVDIPIPFHDDDSKIIYEKECYNSIHSECHREVKPNYDVKSATELKRAGSWSYFLQQPLSQDLKNLLRDSFNEVIYACADSNCDLLAEDLVSQMQNLGLEPSCGTYDGFIKALVSVRSFHHGIEALHVMKQKSLKPYNSTLAALSASCSRGLQLDLAENFLVQISKSSEIYPFNAFMEACDTLDQPGRALQALAKMKILGVKPNIRTYELLFSLFANVNAPYEIGDLVSKVGAGKRIKAIEMDMKRHGIQHNHLSIHNLLKALGMEGMIVEMIHRLQVAEHDFYYKNDPLATYVYNTVLHMLIGVNKCGKAIKVFRNMISCRISPDQATYGIMIECCSIMKCFNSACGLISQMIRHGFCLNAVILTAFIKILIDDGEFTEALKLVDSSRSDGIQPDVVLYNTILLTARIKGRIDVIETIVERMHREKIQPDPTTCNLVFSTYVYRDFFTTAIEALQVLCMRMLSEEDDIREEYRLRYENLIMSESEAESRIFDAFKNTPYVSVALQCLRWCAILIGNPVSWTPNKSQWAQKLSSDYDSNFRNPRAKKTRS